MSQEDEGLSNFMASQLHEWMMQRLDFNNQDHEAPQYFLLFTVDNSS